MQTDHEYLQRCEALSIQAALKGNSAAGAIIVKDNIVIAEAEEAARSKNDITCHAEIEVIRMAVHKMGTNDLSDCILYSTHEPCIMCAYAIRFHRIKKVVYRNAVSYLGSISSSMPLLITNDVPPHWAKAPVIVQEAGADNK
ncbi:hypothetical protein BH10BAC2_BH10BAC2_21840 [soil metagenome]